MKNENREKKAGLLPMEFHRQKTGGFHQIAMVRVVFERDGVTLFHPQSDPPSGF